MAAQSTLRRSPALVLLAVVLLARSRLLTGPRDAIRTLRGVGLGRGRASDEEVQRALQEVYKENEDGSRTVLVPHRGRISEVRTPTSTPHAL
jgi:ATP-binding cassette, subfamily D (ALD), peroxisomal long-chain fatty acid import protein